MARRAHIVLIILLLAGFINPVYSALPKKKKKGAFKQGQSDWQLGMGFFSFMKPKTDSLLYYGIVETKAVPPIQIRYEYALTDNIGMGGMIAMAFAHVKVTDNTDPENINGIDYSYFMCGARFLYHYPLQSEFIDPYVASTIGITLTGSSPYGPSNPFETYKKTFLWGIHAGANVYFLEDFMGAFLEVGYGMSVMNAGLTFKF